MSKDRIQIDGVWYVKEDKPEVYFDVIEYEGRLYESDLYCFEVTRMRDGDGVFYEDVDFEFTDKREKPWYKEHWDNNKWLLGILDNDPESIADVDLCSRGISELQYVVQDLLSVEWIKRS